MKSNLLNIVFVCLVPFGALFLLLYRFLKNHHTGNASIISDIDNMIKSVGYKYFTISELCKSQTAVAKGIDNTPTDVHKANLGWLIENFLDPIREEFGEPIRVNSGYRSKALNDVLPGSSKTSSHLEGLAADIVPQDNTEQKRQKLFTIIKKYPIDQLLYEYNSSGSKWIHLGVRKENPRGYVNNNYNSKV